MVCIIPIDTCIYMSADPCQTNFSKTYFKDSSMSKYLDKVIRYCKPKTCVTIVSSVFSPAIVNSARLIVLLSLYFYTYSPHHLRYLPCHGTAFLFFCRKQSVSLFRGNGVTNVYTSRSSFSLFLPRIFFRLGKTSDDHLTTSPTVIITVSVESLLKKVHKMKTYFCLTVDFRISRVTTSVHTSDILT
jgi:hypothetical protein